LALASALGEFVAFTDDDCLVAPGWIRGLMAGMVSEEVAGCGGAQRPPAGETSFGRRVQAFLEAFGFVGNYVCQANRGILEVPHNPSCNVLYRRQVLVDLGGFHPGLWPGEDLDLDHRLRRSGYRLTFNPQAVVAHYRPESMRALCRMMYRYGRAQAQLVALHGPFRPLHIAPFTVLALALATLVLLFLRPVLASACIGLALLLLLPVSLIRAGSVVRGVSSFALLFVCVPAWHAGFFLGFRGTSRLSRTAPTPEAGKEGAA
jgi:GT2 family glycosyltransferase